MSNTKLETQDTIKTLIDSITSEIITYNSHLYDLRQKRDFLNDSFATEESEGKGGGSLSEKIEPNNLLEKLRNINNSLQLSNSAFNIINRQIGESIG